jgi:hypothetical protein
MENRKLPEKEWDYPHRVTSPAYSIIDSMYRESLGEDEVDQILNNMENGKGPFYSAILLGYLLESKKLSPSEPNEREKMIENYFGMPEEFSLEYYMEFVKSKSKTI